MSAPLWREISRKSFTKLGPLLDFLEISSKDRELFDPNPEFPLLLPLRLAEKIVKKDPNDPLLLQFVSLREEKIKKSGYCLEPVQDQIFRIESKLLQKYHGRSLVISTSACAMHCRFCFRKNFPYDLNKDFEKEFNAIERDPSIREVILSGGDPLSLSDETLGSFFDRLGQVPHLKRIRFHTRFPLGIPERIDESFCALLKKSQKQVVFIISTNHPLELDDDVFQALKRISCLGIPVLTQTVLLRGVNDDVKTLKELFELLVDHGIIPYYLHDLDRVEGTHHFEVEEKKGLFLIQELQKCLSGYAVPHYVREIPGEPSKTRLF